jgi:hypothetical protein
MYGWLNLFVPTCSNIPPYWPVNDTVFEKRSNKNADKDNGKNNGEDYPFLEFLFTHSSFAHGAEIIAQIDP